jgi:hypothetical protein
MVICWRSRVTHYQILKLRNAMRTCLPLACGKMAAASGLAITTGGIPEPREFSESELQNNCHHDHPCFDPAAKSSLDRYRNGDRRGVIFYAAAIRHIYVQGHLTAHPNRCDAANVQSICHRLSDFILTLIRDDFTRRLAVAKGSA